MANVQRKVAGDGLASQVAAAKKSIESWPNWMKATANFESGTVKVVSVTAVRSKVHSVTKKKR
jgi:hypothetical protein